MSETESLSKQFHSLIFTDQESGETKNTWDDWHLVPSSRPSFASPKLKTYEQDIPGANGKIDLSSALTGYESYQNRTGSIEFLVVHMGLDTDLGDTYGYNNEKSYAWSGLKSAIAGFIHGKKIKVEYEDAPGIYFLGRLSLNQWKSDQTASTLTIDYDLEPFKYSLQSSGDLWKWDPFNFLTGVIRTYSQDAMKFTSNGTSFRIIGTMTPVVPTIFVTSACSLTTTKGVFSLKAGQNYNPFIMVYPGDQNWVFSGADGSAAVYFRERTL